MKSLNVVVGAQYGSEAKGHVTQRLVERELGEFHDQPVVNVRVAGPNAGHTAYDDHDRSWALRQVPVGAVSPHPVRLVIAAGSEIDREVLYYELDALKTAGHLANKMIYVDPNATLITEKHKETESYRLLVDRIGSTGKGIGAARAERIMRTALRVEDDREFMAVCSEDFGVCFVPYSYRPQDRVIIEGTQGFGLGLHTPFYPQCTSSDCRAIDFLAMANVNPWGEKVDIWAVARMYPIRVAGNSGPMYGETSWAALGLPEERTTVTKKVRRVGAWDTALVAQAVRANGGGAHVKLALTMTDQRWPSIKGMTSREQALLNLERGEADDFAAFGNAVQAATGENIALITTGPQSGFFV